MRQRRLAGLAGVLLLCAAAFALTYGPGLSLAFTSDDYVLLHYVRDASAGDIVRDRLLRGPRSDLASPWWRPGWLLLFNAAYETFGLWPAAWRGLVWVLHAAMVGVVFAAARRLNVPLGLAAAGTLLFAVAPSHHEAMLWVCAGLNVLPAALLLFTAALAYARAVETRSGSARLVAWLSFLLSFLFREAAYHMPLVVFLAHATLQVELPPARRCGRGLLHALPFAAVVLLHNVFLNPFSVGHMTPMENARIAAGHAAHWLHALFAVPVHPWAVLAAGVAVPLVALRLAPRPRFCLLWAIAASFPFVARSHETRFLYFVHAPLALAIACALADAARARPALRLVLPLLLFAVAGLDATRVPAQVAVAAANAATNVDFLARAGTLEPTATRLHVDFLPPELASGAREMLDIYLRRDVEVVNHALLDRPPFLIFGLPGFADLADDAAMLHFDHASRRFVPTTRGALVARRPLVPMFAFRHQVKQVAAWSEVRFDRDVAHLMQVPPPLDLAGDGAGKVVSVSAGTVSRFDFQVDTPRDGYLVIAFISDLCAVGGQAFVDGESVPLLVVDGLFNGVPVRKGTHAVTVKTAL